MAKGERESADSFRWPRSNGLEFRKWHLILRCLLSWPELPLLMEEKEKKLVCGDEKGESSLCALLCPILRGLSRAARGLADG